MILSSKRITKVLISLRECAGWSAPLLFANPPRTGFLTSRHILFEKKESKMFEILEHLPYHFQEYWLKLLCVWNVDDEIIHDNEILLF